MGISRQHRFSKSQRCPICGGCDQDPRGAGKRCMGFMGSDGTYAHCSREDFAGALELEDSGTYAHKMKGPCKCGVTHREDYSVNGTSSRSTSSSSGRKLEACYAYTDEAGQLLSEVVRYSNPKTFRQRHMNGGGEWVWDLNGVRIVLYRLHELVQDDGDRPVYIVEGEKDADALAARGYLATCNPMGAGKWSKVAELAREVLKGRDVVVVADNDAPGWKHAREVAASLEGVARSVVRKEPPVPHKDVFDLLAAKGTLEDLVLTHQASNEVEKGEPIDEAPLEDPQAEEKKPPRWEALVLAAPSPWFTEKPPARTWLLKDARSNSEGVLPVATVGMFVAEGGAGKTMAMCQLAVAIATGSPWLGALDVVAPGRVLLCLGEEDHEEARRRLYRARRSGNTRIPNEGTIVTLPMRGQSCALLQRDSEGNQTGTSFGAWLLDYVHRSGPWALVVIDPLSRFAGPDAETDNAVGTVFVTALEAIASSGACVLCAHHTNKVSRGPNGGGVTIASSRGVSSITDGARWGATLSSERLLHGSLDINDRLGEIVTLTFGKSNVSRIGDPILLRRDRDNGGAFLPLDETDLELVTEARKPKRAARSVQQEAERQLTFEQREGFSKKRKLHNEAQRRTRDEEDDLIARQLRMQYPEASERDLAAFMKKAATCGSERAQDALRRTKS